MPLATSSAAYWICKARVAAKAVGDDFSSALTVLDEAEQHQPQVISSTFANHSWYLFRILSSFVLVGGVA